MKKLTAYCVSKRKRVVINKVLQVWKAKGRGHFLYLVEGEAPGCPINLWRAVGEEDAHEIAKEIGKPIKMRVSKKKKKVKKAKKKRTKSKKKGKKGKKK